RPEVADDRNVRVSERRLHRGDEQRVEREHDGDERSKRDPPGGENVEGRGERGGGEDDQQPLDVARAVHELERAEHGQRDQGRDGSRPVEKESPLGLRAAPNSLNLQGFLADYNACMRAVLPVLVVALVLAGTAGGAEPPACTVTGTAGNDHLVGTPGKDVIC